MKHRLFILICLCVYCVFSISGRECNAMEGYGLPVYTNVKEIAINSDGPSYLEHQKYSYTTSSKNEIIYILHYISNFNLKDDGEILYANDVSSYSIKIYMLDGNKKEYGFYSGRFYDDSGKQYAIDGKECKCFLDFINGLKTEKLVLPDEVILEPSEWAKTDVEKAILDNLVPKWNQINYAGYVTRVEACQLIYNMLDKAGYTNNSPELIPFSDTTDTSVTNLRFFNIIRGKSETEFCPYDYITREEFAEILANTYSVISNMNPSITADLEYSDTMQISDWAIESVKKVSGLGLMQGDDESRFNPKINITKEEVIVTLLRLYELN